MEFSLYRPAGPPSDSVWVSEDAFGFLEPSLAKHCSQYREMSHWGITEIPRDEWPKVAQDWKRIALSVSAAGAPEAYSEAIWYYSAGAESQVRDDFAGVKAALPTLIAQLTEWVDAALSRHSSIFLRGV